jgi:hypothetical protein
MFEAKWIEWTRTRLEPHEREDLLTALTSEQTEQLYEHDYVWVKGIGVLWKPPEGALRRARFTHGTLFRTERGEFHIDSEGSVREFPQAETMEENRATNVRPLHDGILVMRTGAAIH